MADMTEAEMVSFAERHGLVDFPPDQLARMRELSVKVAATGGGIGRMAEKWQEPAGVFRVPLRG